MHYPWQCLSIFRKDYFSTLDLVISDEKAILALLHMLHQRVFKPQNKNFMSAYKLDKFRMKLIYEAFSRKIELPTLIQYGVIKTLQQKVRYCSDRLKKFIRDPKFYAQHHLAEGIGQEECKEIQLEKQSLELLTHHIRIMNRNIECQDMTEFFKDERDKLKARQAQISDCRNEIETYGNALYDFCYYRMKFRDFHLKHTKLSTIHSMDRVIWEVVKCV